MSTEIYAVLHLPNGNLQVKQSPPSGAEPALKSHNQVVAVYVKRTIGDPPQDFWDEFSGNSMYKVQEETDGLAISAHDINPAKTRIKGFENGNQGPWREIDPKLANATMGGNASWDTLDDGQGTYYEQKLAEARVLVGYPSS
jgi:hypothetical protein